MQCQRCQQKPATVHLTQVVDGDVKKIHLCEACAEESGVDLKAPVSIEDLLVGLGKALEPDEAEEAGAGISCPHCHLRHADFKKTGRLGCPRCYETFETALQPLIRAMHRTDQHVGKIPREREAHLRSAARLAQWQRELDEAVAREQYERAAELRDRMQEERARAEAGAGEEPA